MAGIKFHGAIDTEISRNHIYNTCLAIWLDWMAQGPHVTRNLMHDNTEVVALPENPTGDHQFHNNVFVGRGDMSTFDRPPCRCRVRSRILVPVQRTSRSGERTLIEKVENWLT